MDECKPLPVPPLLLLLRPPLEVRRGGPLPRGSHSYTSQLNLSRFGHTSPRSPV